jgi:hypothetical protein
MNPKLETLGSYYSSLPVSNAYVHDGAVVRGRRPTNGMKIHRLTQYCTNDSHGGIWELNTWSSIL